MDQQKLPIFDFEHAVDPQYPPFGRWVRGLTEEAVIHDVEIGPAGPAGLVIRIMGRAETRAHNVRAAAVGYVFIPPDFSENDRLFSMIIGTLRPRRLSS